MNRELFDWNRLASDVFITVLAAIVVGGTPVLGIAGNGDVIFAVGI